MIRDASGNVVEVRSALGVDPAAIPPHGVDFGASRAGVVVSTKTALQVDSVFTALRVITNAVIKLGNPRGYTLGYDAQNQAYRKWLPSQPSILTNTFGDLFQFDGQTRTVMSLGLFGEAFWYTLDRDYLRRPAALEVLNPAIITPDKNNPGDWLYGVGASRKRLAGEDVTHIPFMTLPGGQRGLSAVDYAGASFALALAALQYGETWFAQGASPSYLLSTDQKLGTDEVKRIAQRFMVDHSGLSNAHLPLVVDSGLKVQKIQSTPDEAQYLNTLQYARSCIGAWFGLPPHLIGGDDGRGNVWGRTLEEQALQLVDYTISGYTTRLNEAYSSLLPRGQFAVLDEDLIIRANSQDRAAEILAVRTAGVESKNEIRVTRLKRPPVEGGDELTDPLNSNASPGVGAVFAEEAASETGQAAPVDPNSQEAA